MWLRGVYTHYSTLPSTYKYYKYFVAASALLSSEAKPPERQAGVIRPKPCFIIIRIRRNCPCPR